MTSGQAHEHVGPGSLTPQQIALRRLRTFGTLFLSFGLLGVVAGIAIMSSGTLAWVGLIMSAMWLCFAALGVVMLIRYSQQRSARAPEHGRVAGEK